MDWLKSNRSALIVGTIFLLGFAVLLVASQSNFVSYDTYWHLKIGEDWLGSGLSSARDRYSFTFGDRPVSGAYLVFQVVLAGFVELFGFAHGLWLLKVFAMVLFGIVLFAFYRQIGASWHVVFVTLPFICLFLLYRSFHIRPEIFDNVLIVAALVLYLRAKDTFSHANLALIAALQLFWVNYHAAILGYVIFFGLFVDRAVDMLRARWPVSAWYAWAAWGGFIFLLGFANSDLQHPLFAALGFADEWSILNEHRATGDVEAGSAIFTAFWLISACLVAALLYQREFGLAVVCCIFAYKSWEMFRLVTMSGVVIGMVAAYSIGKIDIPGYLAQKEPRARYACLLLGGILALGGFYLAGTQAGIVKRMSNSMDFPHSIVAYLRQAHPDGGKIFNRMRDGGYLMYHLAPEFKVYIDGRSNILYPLDFVTRYKALYTSAQGESLAGEIERYDIDFAIFPIEMAQLPLMDTAAGLDIELVSDRFILLSSRAAAFPVSGRYLYYPMCWDPSHAQALAVESARAKQVLPDDSVLIPILNTLGHFAESPGPDRYLESIVTIEPQSDYYWRLLAYVSLESRYFEQAFKFFKAINSKKILDLLMIAYVSIELREFELAENVLTFVASGSRPPGNTIALSDDEQLIAASLFETLKALHPLGAMGREESARLALAASARNPALSLPLASPIPRAGCNSIFAGLDTTGRTATSQVE